jgi:hypothetical protein
MSLVTPITLSEDQVKGFQSLYRDTFGVELEMQEAGETLRECLDFYRVVDALAHPHSISHQHNISTHSPNISL